MKPLLVFGSMLSETDIHYLVGLLSLISNPDDVEVELGSKVVDTATNRKRDVDITFKIKDVATGARVFKGIEVKDHGRKLDVTHVEQLAQKLKDMPTLAIKCIVSATGYTSPAIKKAAHHGIELFELIDWDFSEKQFEHFDSQFVPFVRAGFTWASKPSVQINPEEKIPEDIASILKNNPLVSFEELGSLKEVRLNEKINEFCRFSVQRIFEQYKDKEMQVGHTVEVDLVLNITNNCFVDCGASKFKLKSLRYRGRLVWAEHSKPTFYKVLKRLGDEKPYAGCMVAELDEWGLMGVSVSQHDRTLRFIRVSLSDRNRNSITKQKLKLSP